MSQGSAARLGAVFWRLLTLNEIMRDSTAMRLTIAVLWTILSIAAAIYAWRKGIPNEVAIPAAIAFLAEAGFYASIGFETGRNWFARAEGRWRPGLWLALSALIPYLIYCAAPGRFSMRGLGLLVLISLASSFWFLVLPQHTIVDLGYLVLAATLLLSGVFKEIFPPAGPKSPVDILGNLALIRMGVISVLVFRKLPGVGFGFIPSRIDWISGVKNFAYFLPLMLVLGIGLGFARPKPIDWTTIVPVSVGTFLAFLWVVALSEELFFRGMLLPMLMKLFSHRWAGLIATSIVFGLCHLSFRQFPNWEFALLAGVAGIFYGRAFLETQSIRAAMVTHALVVTTWRVFLA